jgi:ATP-dependent Clp protease ATP-binding subunit ClpA
MKTDLLKIVDLELEKVYERVSSIDFELEVEDTLKKHIISIGTDTRFGARILKRTIQKWVDDAITDKDNIR